MTPALIHLHIPKSAGSSHRFYLFEVLGESNVRWFGSSATEGYRAEDFHNLAAVGGHRPLSFYPETMDALFTSVLRDPLERALSYFSFRAGPAVNPDRQWSERSINSTRKWIEQGLDPHSLLNSLEQCEKFRHDVTNLQCKYLSRQAATFSDAKKTLENTNIVVAIMDQLDAFDRFFRNELGFGIGNHLNLNTSSASYQAHAAQDEQAMALLRELNVEDQLLYDYVRKEHAGFFQNVGSPQSTRANLPIVSTTSNMEVEAGHFNWAQVHLLSKGIAGIPANSPVSIPLAVRNGSEMNLVFGDNDHHSCRIGWRLLTGEGTPIERANGVAQLESLVPAKSTGFIEITVTASPEQLAAETPKSIEFSIVADDEWINERHPLNSAWSQIPSG